MYYVYIIRSGKTGELYYGYTSDLTQRIKEHNSKQAYELVYYEAYKSSGDARNREIRLKQYAQALTALKSRLKESLK
ncbi:MAG: GIY-YIG nuclease family protein [Candidatus Gorgyraea atricola]|nr:GIY-YIG nuclease family protein [Candidatus Gorgyraea atricola]